MSRRSLSSLALGLAVLVTATALLGSTGFAQGTKPKRGGILNSLLIEDPPGLIIHESATVSNVWPMSPCYSNLVLFDPLKRSRAWIPSSPSWPSGGRGRTTTRTWCSSSART
jgi:hypothetical protein